MIADPSGADGMIYGMAGQSVNSSFHNRGQSSFGNASYGNGMPDPFAKNAGAAWGDGGLLSISLDWNALDLYTNLSFSSTEINVTSSNDIAEVLSTVTIFAHKGGLWKENAGSIMQQHVYANGANYESYRTAQNIASSYAIAQEMQNIGDGAVLIGSGMVLTGYGAPIGAGMVQFGGYLAMAGTALELITDYRAGTITPEKVITKFAMEMIPEGAKKGFKYLDEQNAWLIINGGVILYDRILDTFREAKVGPYRNN